MLKKDEIHAKTESLKGTAKAEQSLSLEELQSLDLLKHYWEGFNFSNEAIKQKPQDYEIILADYLSLLYSLRSIKNIKEETLYPLNQTKDQLLATTIRLYRKYLYEADAPFNDSKLYSYILEWILDSSKTNYAQKLEARELLKIIKKNEVGSLSANFSFLTSTGQIIYLHDLNAPYLMLVFANTDCPSCQLILQDFLDNKELQKAFRQKQISSLLVYLNEEAKTKEMNGVLIGYDHKHAILGKGLYDIRTVPCFYLLKKGGQVLLKESYPKEIVEYMNKQSK